LLHIDKIRGDESVAEYTTIVAQAEAEFVERRSRFIGCIAPAQTPEQAAAFVQKRRAAHRDARHTVFAWLLREGDARRCSDDGEPQGTGGQPVLEVLRREGLTDVCLAVTRYFGGTLLGTGGLTRAYAQAAGLAVAAAERVDIFDCEICAVSVDYPQYGALERLVSDYGARVLEADFAEAVELRIRLKACDTMAFSAALTEATGAAAHLCRLHREFAPL
jgi:uncharacterized YigZ family protein